MDRHPRPPSQTSHALALMMAMFVTWTLGVGGLMERVFFLDPGLVHGGPMAASRRQRDAPQLTASFAPDSVPSTGERVQIVTYPLRLVLHGHVCRVTDAVERIPPVLIQSSEQSVEVVGCRAGQRHELEGLADSTG
jgi:hypothetical protein